MRLAGGEKSRVGIYGWGLVAPRAGSIRDFEALLRSHTSGLKTVTSPELGQDLFAVGDPEFSIDTYADWITERHGASYFTRMKKKMGDNVGFTVGAAIQALECTPDLEQVVRDADDACHVYVGSGVGDLREVHEATRTIDRATRRWNHFWASRDQCEARAAFETSGVVPEGAPPPPAPSTLPEDSIERAEAAGVWDEYWAAHSNALRRFFERFSAIEKLGPTSERSEDAHLDGIRRRAREERALLAEVGCPQPPFSSVDAKLIWNIQNAPAAQLTMLLGIHGAAWAPVGACSTFGIALKCGRDAILRGEAKMAIIGTADPRPDAALIAAFHAARVMPGSGEVNSPFTSLRGTHLSGGSCIWILGDESHCAARGLRPVGGWVEGIGLSSDAEHIITPSLSGPKRAIRRAFDEAHVRPDEIALFDLHATGTPGDLNELALVQEFVSSKTRITARKGQLGHGMANSGGWELTALAMGLAKSEALGTSIDAAKVHPKMCARESLVCETSPITGSVGAKLMLGIGGIASCVVLRRDEP